MFSSRCLAHSSIVLLYLTASNFAYDVSSNTNIAMYYGQGPGENELGLGHFCDSTSVDIIPLGFMNRYIAQANGYPGMNFGGSCWADNYTAPGYNGVNDPTMNDLKKKCPTMVSGIPYCQSLGKKILLSLGGQALKENSYALTSVKDAEYMADFLWGAFGPLDSSANWPRPFDTENVVNEVDGFDFDIEYVNPGEQEFYIILITRLRGHFASDDKEYIITGAPQCNFPDLQMGDIINAVAFDMLFIQYYNTPECSAREWVQKNPGYGVSTNVENASGFKKNFDALVASLPSSKSKDVKLYIGLLGSTSAGVSGDYLDPTTEAAALIKAHFCNPYLGGIMIYDAGHSEENVGSDGKPFYEEIKDILVADSVNTKEFTCATTGVASMQGSYPTGNSGGGGGGGTVSTKATTVSMTLCPTAPGSFSTVAYKNSAATANSNHTSVLYSNSSSRATPAALTSTILPLTTSTTIIASHSSPTTTSSTTNLDSSSSAKTPSYNSISTLSNSTAYSNRTISGIPGYQTPTPTYSFNLNLKSSSSSTAANGQDCFIVILTLSLPDNAPQRISIPTATSKTVKLVRTNGNSPLSVGSCWFFAFSVGVPATFGLFGYILGRIVL